MNRHRSISMVLFLNIMTTSNTETFFFSGVSDASVVNLGGRGLRTKKKKAPSTEQTVRQLNRIQAATPADNKRAAKRFPKMMFV
jgi:hypothetical protein